MFRIEQTDGWAWNVMSLCHSSAIPPRLAASSKTFVVLRERIPQIWMPLERPEVPPERHVLVDRQMLLRKEQNEVLREKRLDFVHVRLVCAPQRDPPDLRPQSRRQPYSL